MSFDDSRHRARRVAIVAAGVLLTAMIALPAIWAQEQERPPSDLSSLTVAGSVSVINFGPINVVGCAKKQDHLVCNFVLKNDSTSTVDVKYGGSVWTTKLVDNFRIDHSLVRGYFLNGLGQRQDMVTLGQGDWVWAVQEFAGPNNEITSVRVVFLGLRNQSVVVSLDSGTGGGAHAPSKSP
jgi:hypothetical protein